MPITRRGVLTGAGGMAMAPALSSAGRAAAGASLPDRRDFDIAGTDLNAAYTHPLGRFATGAMQDYLRSRARDPSINWPFVNPRDEAVRRYAGLIGAAAADVAVVPSTLEGENLVGDAIGLGPGAGVVTDALHYDASLVWYAERAKRGMPLAVIRPRGIAFDYDDFAAAITPATRLVAVSLVTSATGYRHDLKRLCEIAHAEGALVYADVIQAAGAIPFDVRESGVDFCCAGTYKWLLGDFGTAFLYVKPSVRPRLHRVQFGWRGLADYRSHALPGDPPGPAIGDWTLDDSTAGIFEVSTPNWSGLAVAAASFGYLSAIGVDAIARHRAPLLARLKDRLLPAGYTLLAPDHAHGPALVFGRAGVKARYGAELRAAAIYATVWPDRIRIAPSVHNDMADIDRIADVLVGT